MAGELQRTLAKVKVSEVKLLKDGSQFLNPRRQGKMFYGDLAESMKIEGLKHPITVMRVEGKFHLLDGDRRLAAAKELGWKEIDAVVIDGPQEALEFMLLSDMREPLRPTALAAGVVKLHVGAAVQWPIPRIAKALGKTVEEVDLLIALHNADASVQAAVDSYYATDGKVGMPLSAWRVVKSRPKTTQVEVAERATVEKMTVAQVRTAVKTEDETGKITFDIFKAQATEATAHLNRALAELRVTGAGLSIPERQKIRAILDEIGQLVGED